MNHAKKLTKKKNNVKGTTVALTVIAVIDLLFTAAMIWLFYLYQDVPDSLIASVFGVTFGECGFCTMIYKVRNDTAMKDKHVTIGDVTGFDDAEVLDDGVYRTDISGKTKIICDPRYGELEYTGKPDRKPGTD